MVLTLRQKDKDFEIRFATFLENRREALQDVDHIVRDILNRIRQEGDKALIDYSRRFDHIDLEKISITVSSVEINDALSAAPQATVKALHLASERIESYHKRQIPNSDHYRDVLGVEFRTLWKPVESVGLYVPGGTASYPSSVLMSAIPAKVAGVERIAMVVPAPDSVLNPLVLVAAHLAGVSEIYRIGGAQAIAALAYGTETIKPVAKIFGPGNAYVAAAKRLVFGTVGIDMIAGPSEVLIVADKDNDPDWIAADLLAQAEHDVAAQSILLTDNEFFAHSVGKAVEYQLNLLPRASIAKASWRDFGAMVLVENFAQAIPLINRIAPEHLEIATTNPDALLSKICNAGAIFLGKYTPEVIGDYIGGSNHILPTARSARFSSGLSVHDYMKRIPTLKLGKEQLRALGPTAIELAHAEGLDAHSRSVSIRLN